MQKKEISLIICTRNRADILSKCLDSITLYKNNTTLLWEIIVVDNDSSDNTRTVVENYDHVKYYMESEEGLSSARNAAVQFAKGEWLIYLDDDTRIFADFFKEIEKIILEYDFDAFTGRYVAWYEIQKPKWIPDTFGNKINHANEIQELGNDFVTGCIMGFKKEVFARVGLFPTHLGMKGKKIAYGEETYLVDQIKNKGLKIGINPNLIVEHLVRKDKLTLMWHLKSAYARGRDEFIMNPSRSYLSLLIQPVYLLFKNIIPCTYKLVSNKRYYWQNYIIDLFQYYFINTGRILGKLISR